MTKLTMYTILPVLLRRLKRRREPKISIKVWREALTYGDKVTVNDGAVKFNAQITQVWSDRVQVISPDMRVAAYPKEVIYPID